jgi:DNA-binding winged helix-turn-helix (wHTH) protein
MIEFPPFRLDTVNQCVASRRQRRRARFPLPPKTFAVLRYLAEQAGRLVTEEELLAVVWPKAYVQREVIKTQLHGLRKILVDNPKTPQYIETLPGRGYRFLGPIGATPSVGQAVSAAGPRGRLVSRDPALARLRDCLRTALSGERRIVLIAGTREFEDLSGDRDSAQRHRDLSRAAIVRIADSLPAQDPDRALAVDG